MDNIIINRVSESSLVTIDLEEFYSKNSTAVFDLKDYLFMGLMLKEKDYRSALQSLDWEQYRGKHVAITCSADAIVPVWAYMLAASSLQPIVQDVFFGNKSELQTVLLLKNIAAINGENYTAQRVIVKGCGDRQVPEAAYVAITAKLRPHARSIMYGEACSNVPVFKRK